MKRLFLIAALGVLCVSAFAQGTVEFSNFSRIGLGVNAAFYESDGVTPLSGPQFMAELLAGALADNLAPLATIPFSTGNGAGYFFGGSQTINSVIGGQLAWVQVDVWNTTSGSSFGQAQASGLPNSWYQSSIFTVQTGTIDKSVTAWSADWPWFFTTLPQWCSRTFHARLGRFRFGWNAHSAPLP